MKYFEVKECIEKSKIKINDISWEEINSNNKKENVGLIYFEGKKEYLTDFFEHKKDTYVSKRLKDVIKMYTDNIKFNLVMLNNIEEKISEEYYRMDVPKIEGLHETTTFFKDNTVDVKVIDNNKVKVYPIFSLKELEKTKFSPKHIFVSLDIVESILRRELLGMAFNEVLVEEE